MTCGFQMQKLTIQSLPVEVSIGLAGCGAGMAGFMKRSLVRRCGALGELFAECKAAGTHIGGCICPHAWHLGVATIKESLGDGAWRDNPEKYIQLLLHLFTDF